MSQPQFEEGTTLDRFILESRMAHPGATGVYVNLIKGIELAGKMISSRVNKAGLAGMLGAVGNVNVQGEEQQKLDVYANNVFISSLEHRGAACMIVSEESDGVVRVGEQWHSGRYVVTVDPLDGSSNIDVNATIGTIFGIYRRLSEEGTPAQDSDVLRPGYEMVSAGYIIYGAGTMLVLASDGVVNGFTLDPAVGEFFLSHPDIQVPNDKVMYSINDAYAQAWQPGVKSFIEEMQKPERKASARYIGSLVADFHRNLLKGGVFLYPATAKNPEGKLRLLYEAFPLGYIIEAAGGAATNGRKRILDLTPDALHARTPLVIGSKALVAEATELMSQDPALA